MKIAKTIKKMMIDKDITQVQMAGILGITKQNVNDQLRRDNFRLNDIAKIADIMGYDVQLQFIDRSNGKVIDTDIVEE